MLLLTFFIFIGQLFRNSNYLVSETILTCIKVVRLARELWRADCEKPMRTGHKQGEMQLNCFYL
jgi:hypothetical protein